MHNVVHIIKFDVITHIVFSLANMAAKNYIRNFNEKFWKNLRKSSFMEQVSKIVFGYFYLSSFVKLRYIILLDLFTINFNIFSCFENLSWMGWYESRIYIFYGQKNYFSRTFNPVLTHFWSILKNLSITQLFIIHQ